MTTKVLGPDGVERTLDVVKVLGPDNVVRTLDFIKILGPDGVVREVFTAGGGGGGDPPNPTYISPAYSSTSGKTSTATAYFTANSSDGVPSAYAWGVIDPGGTIISGGTSQTAQLRVTAISPGDTETATFYCDMTIGADVFRATCTMSRTWTL